MWCSAKVSTATGPSRARSGRGWLTTLRRFHHLGYERVSMLIAQDACHFAGECRRGHQLIALLPPVACPEQWQ